MTDTDTVHPSQIERHFQQVLSTADEANLPLVQDVLHESPTGGTDSWW
jgi:hypothetical protein